MDLGDHHELHRVGVLPVSQFVREDGFELSGFRFLDERVEEDDVFALSYDIGQWMKRAIGANDLPMGDRRSRRSSGRCVWSRQSRTGP